MYIPPQLLLALISTALFTCKSVRPLPSEKSLSGTILRAETDGLSLSYGKNFQNNEGCRDQKYERACIENLLSPTVCTPRTYSGFYLNDGSPLVAFADGRCAAERKLRSVICQSGLDPALFGEIECGIDPSVGHCLTDLLKCDESHDPQYCRSTTYGGEKILEDQQLVAWGGNPCLARHALHRLACNYRLDPKSIGGIVCLPSTLQKKFVEQCHESLIACPPGNTPTTCSASGYENLPLETQLTADGQNNCQAKMNLRMTACRKPLLPDSLTGIACEANNSIR